MKTKLFTLFGAALLGLATVKVSAQTTTTAPATVQRTVSAVALRAVVVVKPNRLAKNSVEARISSSVRVIRSVPNEPKSKTG